jgi:hypothetical protein
LGGDERRGEDKLSGIINDQPDVIGYALAINGRVNSADVYASNALFRKLIRLPSR